MHSRNVFAIGVVVLALAGAWVNVVEAGCGRPPCRDPTKRGRRGPAGPVGPRGESGDAVNYLAFATGNGPVTVSYGNNEFPTAATFAFGASSFATYDIRFDSIDEDDGDATFSHPLPYDLNVTALSAFVTIESISVQEDTPFVDIRLDVGVWANNASSITSSGFLPTGIATRFQFPISGTPPNAHFVEVVDAFRTFESPRRLLLVVNITALPPNPTFSARVTLRASAGLAHVPFDD